jgi:hypothetical protein
MTQPACSIRTSVLFRRSLGKAPKQAVWRLLWSQPLTDSSTAYSPWCPQALCLPQNHPGNFGSKYVKCLATTGSSVLLGTFLSRCQHTGCGMDQRGLIGVARYSKAESDGNLDSL